SPQSTQASRKEVASLDWSFDITQKLEWTDKLAARRSRFNEADSLRKLITTHTLLSIHRLNYNVWKAIEVGGEYRILYQHETRTQREGWLTELGWRAKKNIRLGVGYNFSGFSDNLFSNNDYSVKKVFVRVQVVL
ncbi:MAG: hypothetical protein OEM38_05205, partial [Gammaproteobacteria bacterium]|nr:hypothetical protein [Gammaproteobacteria bacterium]